MHRSDEHTSLEDKPRCQYCGFPMWLTEDAGYVCFGTSCHDTRQQHDMTTGIRGMPAVDPVEEYSCVDCGKPLKIWQVCGWGESEGGQPRCKEHHKIALTEKHKQDALKAKENPLQARVDALEELVQAARDLCKVKEGDIGWDDYTWTVTVSQDDYVTLQTILTELDSK